MNWYKKSQIDVPEYDPETKKPFTYTNKLSNLFYKPQTTTEMKNLINEKIKEIHEKYKKEWEQEFNEIKMEAEITESIYQKQRKQEEFEKQQEEQKQEEQKLLKQIENAKQRDEQLKNKTESQKQTEDAQYFLAIKTNNKQKLEKIVLNAANQAGYTIPGMHYTDEKFTVFDSSKLGKHDSGYYGKGFYFIPSYFPHENKPILETMKKNLVWWPSDLQGNYQINVFLKSDATVETNNAMGNMMNNKINKDDYDGVIVKDAFFNKISEIMVKNNTQIKSSDLITKDNQGNIIPISKRFNPNNQDIRF